MIQRWPFDFLGIEQSFSLIVEGYDSDYCYGWKHIKSVWFGFRFFLKAVSNWHQAYKYVFARDLYSAVFRWFIGLLLCLSSDTISSFVTISLSRI